MPMIDVAVTQRGTVFKSAPFCDCLRELGWLTADPTALALFTAMCNNNIFCPTISKASGGKLKMVWENETRGLYVWLHPLLDDISFATVFTGEAARIKTTNYEGAKTLVEYWASFVAQGEQGTI